VHRLADREEATILLTRHDLHEAERLADRILILAGGTIIADGSADELAIGAACPVSAITSTGTREPTRF